jgi:hypothetical protein
MIDAVSAAAGAASDAMPEPALEPLFVRGFSAA